MDPRLTWTASARPQSHQPPQAMRVGRVDSGSVESAAAYCLACSRPRGTPTSSSSGPHRCGSARTRRRRRWPCRADRNKHQVGRATHRRSLDLPEDRLRTVPNLHEAIDVSAHDCQSRTGSHAPGRPPPSGSGAPYGVDHPPSSVSALRSYPAAKVSPAPAARWPEHRRTASPHRCRQRSRLSPPRSSRSSAPAGST